MRVPEYPNKTYNDSYDNFTYDERMARYIKAVAVPVFDNFNRWVSANGKYHPPDSTPKSLGLPWIR